MRNSLNVTENCVNVLVCVIDLFCEIALQNFSRNVLQFSVQKFMNFQMSECQTLPGMQEKKEVRCCWLLQNGKKRKQLALSCFKNVSYITACVVFHCVR